MSIVVFSNNIPRLSKYPLFPCAQRALMSNATTKRPKASTPQYYNNKDIKTHAEPTRLFCLPQDRIETMGKPPAKPSASTGGKPKPLSKTASRAIHKPNASKGPPKPPAAGAAPHKKRPHKAGGGGTIGRGVRINYYEQQRLDRIREKDERKAKKEEKQLVRQKERNAKLKILTKKNRKGQPVMGGRMELLLEQIRKTCAK